VDTNTQTTDEDIATTVARLSRPMRGGRRVIERAAIMAEGSNSEAILEWLVAASWTPEDVGAGSGAPVGGGLHGLRRDADRDRARGGTPRRYVSPAGDGA
jgi:hypothetical protein